MSNMPRLRLPVYTTFKYSKKLGPWDRPECLRLADGVPFPPYSVCDNEIYFISLQISLTPYRFLGPQPLEYPELAACHQEIQGLDPDIPYSIRAGLLYRHSKPIWTTLQRLTDIVGDICVTADQDAAELISAMGDIDRKYAAAAL